ncbi:uncharacterized protein Pop5 [Chelonus insularis]|uniref:uncharacterized protein Pop5 n=1 Tax=Chelonus insularis TaxID=460826 RepID=UPI00158DA49B|nr:uncharacterized protein LOC118066213 [Chelonus insularis]
MVRFKNRYFTIEIIPNSQNEKPLTLNSSALYNAIIKKIQQLYGDFGVAAIKSGLNAKYCNTHTKIALIKSRHGPHKFLINAFPKINDIDGKYVAVKILYIGASLKHCFSFVKKYQEKQLELMWATLKNDSERKKMIEAFMTLTPATKDLR